MDNYLKFSEFLISHYDEAAKLWAATEGVGLTKGDSKDAIQKYLNRNPGLSFVCTDPERNILVGTILCGHDGRRGIIYHLAVNKEYRGKGLGKKLLEHSLEKLKGSGITRCLIVVKEDNSTGTEFWIRTGWDERPDVKLLSKDL